MIKLRKNAKCWLCKKEIKKGSWIYNGHFWHEKCKDKDSAERIKKYVNQKGKLKLKSKGKKLSKELYFFVKNKKYYSNLV